MANRTDLLAHTVHGTNPQNLVEYILRCKIYESLYWKEHCFGLTAESLVDKAVQLNHIGGTYGGQRKPTNFMCLLLKLLQLQPEKEIIIEFIKNEDYKYVRILGAFYLRLCGRPMEVYQYLEPLYNDYRKVRLRLEDGNFLLTHVDELVDQMLKDEYLFDIALPRVPTRLTMERAHGLDARMSVLEEDFDEEALEAEADQAIQQARALEEEMRAGEERERRRRSRSRSRSRDRDRDRRHRDRDEDRGRHKERGRDKDKDDKERKRRRSREREEDGDRGRRRKDDGMSVDETNAMRAKLGLRPLK